MAGVYRVYTMTKKSPYLVHFTCEQCGEKNTWLKVFKVDSSYSDRSTFTKAGLKKQETAAREKLENKFGALNGEITYQLQNKEFNKLHLVARCENCNKKPVWAYSDSRMLQLLKLLVDICLFLAICLSLLTLLNLLENEFDINALKWIAAFSAPGAIYYSVVFFLEQQRKVQVSKLDPRYLPDIEPYLK